MGHDRVVEITPSTSYPYTSLAPLYDAVMAHVDYKGWAEYLIKLCSRHAVCTERVLELGCGTGNLTTRLCRRIGHAYLATDHSEEMLEVARAKPTKRRCNVRFSCLDFRQIDLKETFDVVILAYDGINYLLEREEVSALLTTVSQHLQSGGIFLFDQSTPSNSINNLAFFDDWGESTLGSYARTSDYDAETRIHRTRFDINIGNQPVSEVHYQRAYELEEMEMIVKLSSFRLEACLEGFTFAPATGASERIQWVLAKP